MGLTGWMTPAQAGKKLPWGGRYPVANLNDRDSTTFLNGKASIPRRQGAGSGDPRSVAASLADQPRAGHNGTMKRADRFNLGVSILGLLACVLLNVWVFRYGMLYGLVGLNLTKHVGVAVLCQAIGVGKGNRSPARRRIRFQPAHPQLAGPHLLTRDTR